LRPGAFFLGRLSARLYDADIRDRIVRAVVPLEDKIRDFDVSTLDGNLDLLDIFFPTATFTLDGRARSEELIDCSLRTNQSSLAWALPNTPSRATDATTNEAAGF
jgi:hypothetical protein